ncbi:MAG: Ig-like domain-containing protein [Clostridia bacterium]|nr:Ig-like domain-containing protein [Clostridia bacterium]
MSKMKKVLSIMFLLFVVFCLKTNAYEMNFGNTPAQVSPGETFTVELAVDENTYLANGHITYDSNLFTYVGVDVQNMTASVYEKEGNISWMYTEISNTPVGVKSFKFKFKAKEVTKTSSGDFVVCGLEEEGPKFITTKDYTYSDTEVAGRKLQTVTIYVPIDLTVNPTDMELQVGETKVITSNKDGLKFESKDENIAKVDENGNVTGINPGTTIIKVTDKDGKTAEVKVTVTEPKNVTEEDNSQYNDVIPQAGSKKTFFIIGIVFFAVGAVIFIRYKKYRKLFVIIPLVGMLTLPNITQAFTNIDTTKIKSGIFTKLEDVSNVVAISPNDSFKYGQNLVQSDIDGADGVFAGNNLQLQKVVDKNGNEVQKGNAIGTGYKVSANTLGYEDEVAEYNVVLYGDADGNTTFCDNNDIDVIRKDYVYKKKATDVYKIAANLYAYDDMLDVSDIQRMILKRFDNLDKLKGKDGTDGKDDTTLVNPFPEAESPIKLEPNKLTLDIGDIEKIKATGATGTLTWESRNPDIAEVDSEGNITGISKGNTIITVTDEDGNTATIYVVVKNPATSIIIDPNTWTTELDSGETKQLTYKLTPKTNPYPDAVITWSSSDESIATVDENGVVTPVEVGEVEITVTATVPAEDTADGKERILTDVCKVVINQAASEENSYVDPKDVTLNLNEDYKEKTKDLTIYLSPEYSNSTVEWKIEDGRDEIKFTDTSDTTAKTVTVEGLKVTDKDVKVTVTVTNKNPELPGFTKDVVVRVIKSASEIKDVIGKNPNDVNDPNKDDNIIDGSVYPIVDGTLILPNNSTYYMGVEYDPEDSTSAVEWSSENENIATVEGIEDTIGKITTAKEQQGNTTIKATTTDKGVESDPVKVYVAKIELAGTNTVEEGLDIEDIVANIYPTDLKSNAIKWETENPEIATVDENGKVHGVKEGKTTLTATLCASDGSKTAVKATMEITVNPKLDIADDETGDKITDKTEIIMNADTIRTLSTNVNGDILNVEIIDNDECLDGVQPTDGKINIDAANKTGVATIKISYKNGVTEVINITVIVGKMTIVPEQNEIFQNESTRINVESLAPSALLIKNETVKWSIDDKNTVAKDATIKASGRESAILTAGEQTGKVTLIAEYGETGITATCEVTIKKELEITSGDTLIVPKGKTETIQTNYDNSQLTFKSNSTTIATVGEKTGVVTGVKEGETTITVTTPDGQTKDVQVTVASIELTGKDSVEVGQETTLTASIKPDSLKNNRVVWSSSDTSVATVDSNGRVTGIAQGTTTITATMLDNNGNPTNVKAKKEITVNPKLDLNVSDTIILKVGGTIDITNNSGLNDELLSFTSADDSIADVDNEGVVTGNKAGTTYVTVKYKSGETSTIKVTVIVGTLKIDESRKMKLGNFAQINKTVTPTTLETYGIVWSSSNPSVAEVGSSTGLVIAQGVGTAKITARIAGTDIVSNECTITVKDDIIITAEDILLAKGEKGTVPYEYDGDSADIQWSMSSTDIATVSNGTITANNKVGTAVVTAKNKVTGQSDTANVIVGDITLAGDNQVEVGKYTTITPTIGPDAIKNNRVSWTSSDPSKATVDPSGRVTGIAQGTTTITAVVLDKDGNPTNIKATKTITVNPELNLTSKDTIILAVDGTSQITTNASKDILSYETSNSSVATVNETGLVTGNSVGEATITVQYESGETSTITVKVIVGEIILTNTTVKVGATKEVPRTINPTILESYGVTWESSDTSVAEVGTSTGIVTGKKVGTATITATIKGTKISNTCTVTVTDDVIINEDEIVVAVNQTLSVPFEYNGDKTKINWKVSDTKAQVTKNTDGTVSIKGLTSGTTTLTAVNTTTNKQTIVNVTVIDLTIDSVTSLVVGEMTGVNTNIAPIDLTGYTLKYESSNDSIFTVNNSGLITAKGVGRAVLTVTLTKGNATISRTRTIVVSKSSTTIEGQYGDILTNAKIDTVVGHTPIALKATGTSSEASFTWTSSNTNVATVNSNGQVTIKSAGETTITVTDNVAGGNTVTVTVNVIGASITGNDKIYSPGYSEIGEPNTVSLTSSISPSPISGAQVTYKWDSEDEDIATVNPNTGLVTGITEGTAKITLTATVSGNYGGEVKAQTDIQVEDNSVAQVISIENGITTVTRHSTVTSAINKANDTDTIMLLKNISDEKRFYKVSSSTASVGTAISVSDKVTLDLNGYSIRKAGTDSAFALKNNSNMTITDSKGSGSINLTTKVITMQGNARLTINGGTINGTYSAIENNGTGPINIYINEDTNSSVKVTSTDSDKATIQTKGNIKIGNSTDEKIYVSQSKYNNGTIEFESDETSRPELYIGGGKYAIEIVDNTSSDVPANIYWYNGELKGKTQAIYFDIDLDISSIYQIKLSENYSKWVARGIKYCRIEGKNTNIEDIICEIETNMYYDELNFVYGDVNLDGTVSLIDQVYINQISSGILSYNDIQFKAADLNESKTINPIDVDILLKYIIEAIDCLPVEKEAYNIYSEIYTNRLSMVSNIKTEIPIDIQTEGLEYAKISKVQLTNRDKTTYIDLKNTDYMIENNKYITFLKSLDELEDEYADSNVNRIIVTIETPLGEIAFFITAIEDIADSFEPGDFTCDNGLNSSDYVLYKSILNGELDILNYPAIQEREEEFESYLKIEKGYTDAELTNNNKLYELRKLIIINSYKNK